MEEIKNEVSKKLTKAEINFVIDLVGFIVLILMVLTGSILKWLLPPGSGPDTIMFLTRHEWGDVHLVLSAIFLVAIAMHLCFHWSWIKCMVGKLLVRKNQ